jgi:hypothetical protein
MLLRIRASILRLARGEFGDQRLGAAEACRTEQHRRGNRSRALVIPA